MKLLLHMCCAPCSIMCVEKLREKNIDITGFWYNPNIHPFIEYKSRRDAVQEYSNIVDLPVIYHEEYGLRDFCKNVVGNLDNRCIYCYVKRLRETAKYAKENGFDAFCTTLLYSPYQKHEKIIEISEKIAEEYNIKFYYMDFRSYYKEGQNKARKFGIYMQKYCGCIFSEEERYEKKIIKDKEKYDLITKSLLEKVK